jgi:hypothetical protein
MDRPPMGTTTHFCLFFSFLLTAFHRRYRSPSSDRNAPLHQKEKRAEKQQSENVTCMKVCCTQTNSQTTVEFTCSSVTMTTGFTEHLAAAKPSL